MKMIQTLRKRNALVLISGREDGVHLVAQYSQQRSQILPLPLPLLQEMGNTLAERGIFCHTSPHSGAGKTFNIKYAARLEKYVYLAVNNHMPKSTLMDRIASQMRTSNVDPDESKEAFCLHFDLAETVAMDFFLFELCFLGGLFDNQNGRQWLWNPRYCRLDFETAFETKNRCLQMLPQRVALPSPEFFAADPDSLAAGMGAALFASSRYDATLRRGKEVSSNNFFRLQYVCAALRVLRDMNNSFSLDFSVATGSLLSGAECYDLLHNALQATSVVSLHSFWNFVNVMFWQLRDMHHPDSIISAIMMLDQDIVRIAEQESPPEDSAMTHEEANKFVKDDKMCKESLKGQLVLFAW